MKTIFRETECARQETRSRRCGVRYARRERGLKETRDRRCKTGDERWEIETRAESWEEIV